MILDSGQFRNTIVKALQGNLGLFMAPGQVFLTSNITCIIPLSLCAGCGLSAFVADPVGPAPTNHTAVQVGTSLWIPGVLHGT